MRTLHAVLAVTIRQIAARIGFGFAAGELVVVAGYADSAATVAAALIAAAGFLALAILEIAAHDANTRRDLERARREAVADHQRVLRDAVTTHIAAAVDQWSRERALRDQALDFAYGNLATSTNHRPSRDAFARLAAARGMSATEFAAWAADKDWTP